MEHQHKRDRDIDQTEALPGSESAEDTFVGVEADRDLSGEDLSRGPTPTTRHPAGHVEGTDFAEADPEVGETGGLDDTQDTTQGPTPETRQTMRATDDDAAAAGQPDADRETRGDVGGNQDTEPTRPVGRNR